MAIDFNKLNDPEWRAKVRAEEDAKQALLKEREDKLRQAVHTGLDQYERLSEKERSLIDSVRYRLNTFGLVSEAQEKWLMEIAARVDPSKEEQPSQAKGLLGRLRPKSPGM